MQRSNKFSILTIFILFLIQISAKAQSSNFAIGGAHFMSMADIGSTATDLSSIYSNPAGLSRVERYGIDLGYERRFGLEELSTVSIAGVGKWGRNAFGLSVGRYGFEEYSESKIGITYARRLFSNLDIGGTFDYISYNTSQYGTTQKITFELGIQSQINQNLLIGLYVFSPATIDVTPNQEIPSKLVAGVNYKAGKKTNIHTEISKSIDRNPEFKLGVDYQIHSNFGLRGGSNITQSSYHFGTRYSFQNGLQLLLGIKNNSQLGSSAALSISYNIPQKIVD